MSDEFKVKLEISLCDETRSFIEKLVGAHDFKAIRKTLSIVKDIRRITMATQAEVDAITAQLEAVKTQVGKIGTDLADYIADNPGVSLAELQAKASEVAEALQAVDDSLPEATP